jgi:hypothetical protein
MRWLLALCLTPGALLTGCGGGGGAFGDCAALMGAFDACGGDPVGTWDVTRACGEALESPFADECPASTISGTIGFALSVTITATTVQFGTSTWSWDVDIVVPQSCLGAIEAADCNALAELLCSDPGCTASCQASGADCRCDFGGQDVESGSPAAPYTIANGTMTIDYGGGDTDAFRYCVKGSEMAFRGDGGDLEAMVLKRR